MMSFVLMLGVLGADVTSSHSHDQEDCEKFGGNWMSLEEGQSPVCGEAVADSSGASKKLCPDFNKVLKSARIKNQKANDWILSEIKAGSLWQKRGFENGDRLIKIDGHPLVTPKDVTRIHLALCREKGAQVAVKRGDRLIILSW